MNSNVIKILAIALIIVLIIIFISIIKEKPSLQEKLSNEEIYDYIVDLWAYFEEENIEKYTQEQLVVISITAYDGEVNNGGLCQFFSNSSQFFAPMISNSLEQIKADKHKKQFDNFIKQNNIDINNLDSFVSEDVDDFITKYDDYPFDDFDSEFYELEQTESLYNLTLEYAKNNYDEIFK